MGQNSGRGWSSDRLSITEDGQQLCSLMGPSEAVNFPANRHINIELQSVTAKGESLAPAGEALLPT